MIRLAAALIIAGGMLSTFAFFCPWLEMRVVPQESLEGATDILPPIVLSASPANRAMGFPGFDLTKLEVHLEERGHIDATNQIEPASMYWMFLVVPLVLMITGLSSLHRNYKDWFHLSVLTWVVGLIGAALTIKRGVRDRLELWIRADWGVETMTEYHVLWGAWLAIVGYLVAMIGASWVAYQNKRVSTDTASGASQNS